MNNLLILYKRKDRHLNFTGSLKGKPCKTMCADRALLSLGGIVNHLHNCDKIIYQPDSHNLLCRDFARDATPLVIIADEALQVCLIICANWNSEREYFIPLDRLSRPQRIVPPK